MNNIDFNKVFIIAELSANHNNDLNLAKQTILEIAKTGANAVKVQTFTADSLTLNIDNDFFGPKKSGLWKGLKPYDLFKTAALPYQWHSELKNLAEENGLIFFSSPFDIESVDFLEKLSIPIYKIASLEINDIELIKYVAQTGKPIILSTGVAELNDIELAINTIKSINPNIQISLLKCTSEYPAKFIDANLVTIKNMKETFGLTIGVSDHTPGSTVPIVSVALGAKIVEKHFTLNRNSGGLDAAFSLEPQEFKDMVTSIREAESSLGQVKYSISNEHKLKRRSLFFVKDIKAGQIIKSSDIKSLRPGNGLEPKELNNIIGMKTSVDILKGTPVNWNYLK
jgi:pseudaminic acid synthase